ncbi:MAG: hypothetical protein IJP30_04330 [Clostridia bacterium]|nr:hypothetical protein [Clostridia bacterium]
MAASITHLLVGDAVLRALDLKISDPLLFLCGCLAPDAVHQREDYVRDLKRETHLTQGVTGLMLGDPEVHAMLQQRYREFSHTLKDKTPIDLWRGYLCHLITDELYNRTVRQRLVERLAVFDIHPGSREFFTAIMDGMDRVDRVIAHKYKFLHPLRRVFNYYHANSAGSLLPPEILYNSKQWVCRQYYEAISPAPSELYTVEEAFAFADAAAKRTEFLLAGNDGYADLL